MRNEGNIVRVWKDATFELEFGDKLEASYYVPSNTQFEMFPAGGMYPLYQLTKFGTDGKIIAQAHFTASFDKETYEKLGGFGWSAKVKALSGGNTLNTGDTFTVNVAGVQNQETDDLEFSIYKNGRREGYFAVQLTK